MIINAASDSNTALKINSVSSSDTEFAFRTGSSGGATYGRPLNINPIADNISILSVSTASSHSTLIFNVDSTTNHVTTKTNNLDDGSGNLYITGNINPYTNGTQNIGNGTDRWNTIYATNGTINTSDRRAKTDIKKISNGLEIIDNLYPREYYLKDELIRATEENPAKRHYGLIYDEVENAFSNFGLQDDNSVLHPGKNENEMNGLNYGELIPLLIRSVQQLYAQVQELEEVVRIRHHPQQ